MTITKWNGPGTSTSQRELNILTDYIVGYREGSLEYLRATEDTDIEIIENWITDLGLNHLDYDTLVARVNGELNKRRLKTFP